MSVSAIDHARQHLSDEAADPRGPALATSVGKALAVLDAFRGDGVLLGVTQIAERAGIPKSTAHRLLAVLVERGYIEREGARYRLSRMMFELGNMVAECRPRSLRSVAAPYMSDLYESTHATIHLAVLEDLDVLYVDKIYGHNSFQVPSRVGSRLPALCTALGKVMIAFSPPALRARALNHPIPRLTPRTVVNPTLIGQTLDAARRTGIAHDIEGTRLGARCVAAPIICTSSTIAMGAISMSFSVVSHPSANAESLLKRAAEAISTTLPETGTI